MKVSAMTTTVKEPTNAELDAMFTLADIMAWAGIRGDLAYPCSMAESLVAALGGTATLSVMDFATMSAGDIDDAMRNGWIFSDMGPRARRRWRPIEHDPHAERHD